MPIINASPPNILFRFTATADDDGGTAGAGASGSAGAAGPSDCPGGSAGGSAGASGCGIGGAGGAGGTDDDCDSDRPSGGADGIFDDDGDIAATSTD